MSTSGAVHRRGANRPTSSSSLPASPSSSVKWDRNSNAFIAVIKTEMNTQISELLGLREH